VALGAVAFLLADGLGLLIVGRVLSGLSAGIFTGTATATFIDLATPGAPGTGDAAGDDGEYDRTGMRPAARRRALAVGRVSAAADHLGRARAARAGIDPHRGHAGSGRGEGSAAVAAPAAVGSRGDAHDVRRGGARGFAGYAVLGLFTAVAPDFLAQELGVTSRAVIGATELRRDGAPRWRRASSS
jgi:hypothetical protein